MWKLDAPQRLEKWKHLRETISEQPIKQALQEVADFWANCPWVPYYLEVERVAEWPDPWTLIAENYYCELAKCLGMLYSIFLTSHNVTVEIRGYKSPSLGEVYILLVNEKYVLNMNTGEVVNIEYISTDTDYELVCTLDADKLHISSYI